MDVSDVARLWEANAETWTRLSRAGHDVYRDKLNTPAFLAMLPPIEGLHGLDIGCGEGSNTRHLARRGARMDAIDIAPTFVAHARETEAADPLGIEFQVADALALPFVDNTFDFATSFMALMDVPQPGWALVEAGRVLKPGGFLQFSILHPCFVPPTRRNIRDARGNPVAVEIADYFADIDGRVEEWAFSSVPRSEQAAIPRFQVPRFHRTISQWVDMIGAGGLYVEKLGESMADLVSAAAEPIIADTRIAPIFLHFRARKPFG